VAQPRFIGPSFVNQPADRRRRNQTAIALENAAKYIRAALDADHFDVGEGRQRELARAIDALTPHAASLLPLLQRLDDLLVRWSAGRAKGLALEIEEFWVQQFPDNLFASFQKIQSPLFQTNQIQSTGYSDTIRAILEDNSVKDLADAENAKALSFIEALVASEEK